MDTVHDSRLGSPDRGPCCPSRTREAVGLSNSSIPRISLIRSSSFSAASDWQCMLSQRIRIRICCIHCFRRVSIDSRWQGKREQFFLPFLMNREPLVLCQPFILYFFLLLLLVPILCCQMQTWRPQRDCMQILSSQKSAPSHPAAAALLCSVSQCYRETGVCDVQTDRSRSLDLLVFRRCVALFRRLSSSPCPVTDFPRSRTFETESRLAKGQSWDRFRDRRQSMYKSLPSCLPN